MAENPNAQNNTGAAGNQGGQQPANQAANGGTLLTDDAKGGKPADDKGGKPDDKSGKPDDQSGQKPDDKGAKPDDKSGKPADDKGAKPEGAPEKYENFSAPEGVELDTETLGEFTAVAKELNLSQEKAQKLVDFGPKILQKAQEVQMQKWVEIREGWVSDLKADKEFGGDKLPETVERAKRALSKFGDEKLVKLLLPPNKGGTGFGDNDALIKLLARVDKATSEDTVVDGGSSGKDNRSAAEVLYPNQGKK